MEQPIVEMKLIKKELQAFSVEVRELGGDIKISIEIAETEKGYFAKQDTVSALKDNFNTLLDIVIEDLGLKVSKDSKD